MDLEKKEFIEAILEVIEEDSPDVLENLDVFAKIANDYLNVIGEILIDDAEIKYEKMEMKDTISYVREFLGTISSDYVKDFDKALVDGTFDIFLPEDDLIERPDEPISTPKPFANINIPASLTIEDGAVIVHEFFHFLNDIENVDCSTREYFTELISIYYEIRYMQFLVNKGFDISNLYKALYYRLDATFDSANNLVYSAGVLDVYNNAGKVTTKEVSFVNKFRKIYKGNIRNMVNYYKDDDQVIELEGFPLDLSYVISTLLTVMLLKEPEVSDIKVKYINDNLYNFTFTDVLDNLNTKLEEYPIWINESAILLSEVVGEIYEQIDMHSRSDWSR